MWPSISTRRSRSSLASQTAAARARAEKIASMSEYAADTFFPVVFGDYEITLHRQPVQLLEQSQPGQDALVVRRLPEPAVELRGHHASTDVRDGITRFGAYEDGPHTLELIPVCLESQRENMQNLIERLKAGKYKYRGAERTFATRFTYPTVVTVTNVEDTPKEVDGGSASRTAVLQRLRSSLPQGASLRLHSVGGRL